MSTHDFFLHVIHSLFILLLSGNLSSSKNINNFRFSTQSLQNAQFLFHHVRASLLVSCELTVYVIIIHHRCCCFCFWTELKVILTESFLPLLPHPAISFLSSLRVEIANINQNNGKSYAYRTRKEEEMFKIHFSFFTRVRICSSQSFIPSIKLLLNHKNQMKLRANFQLLLAFIFCWLINILHLIPAIYVLSHPI